MNEKKRTKEGSMLIEAIIGLSIVLVAMVGIITLVSRAISLNADAMNRLVAANLAGEGIEITKYLLDVDWDKVDSGVYETEYSCTQILCFDRLSSNFSVRSDSKFYVDANGMYNYSGGTPTSFKRSILIQWSGESATVNAIVSWLYKGQSQEVQVSEQFFRWRTRK